MANPLPLTSVLSPYSILGNIVETKDFLFNASFTLGNNLFMRSDLNFFESLCYFIHKSLYIYI